MSISSKTLSAFLTAFFFFSLSMVLGQQKNDGRTYTVLKKEDSRYSVWIGGSIVPKGWETTGFQGTLAQCTAHIKKVWTDMRPLSVQKLNLPANTRYKVVINHEEQYSIWPANRKAQKGWRDTGKTGSLKACSTYIEEVWTDMRPLSLRKKLGKK